MLNVSDEEGKVTRSQWCVSSTQSRRRGEAAATELLFKTGTKDGVAVPVRVQVERTSAE